MGLNPVTVLAVTMSRARMAVAHTTRDCSRGSPISPRPPLSERVHAAAAGRKLHPPPQLKMHRPPPGQNFLPAPPFSMQGAH
jgi:hypothetical protein